MSVLQIQARALGVPTRHELFRHIVDAGRPVDVVELTEHLGLHHNAIRQHLAKLVDAGRRAGRQVPGPTSGTTDPVAGLVDAMERHGFEPTAERRGNRVEIVLGACPFATTASADPDTVCGLHLGLAHGAAEELGGIVIDELVSRDPRRGACRLRGHVAP